MNETQQSAEQSHQMPEHVKFVIIIMYSVITMIAVGGNGIVCYLVYAYKRLHTVPNYFIVNLASSDLIMAIFCIPFTFVANVLNYWPFGATMCPIVLYIQVVAVFLSAYTLVAMGIDRYIVIVHPFKNRITIRQTVFVILGIWVLSLSIPLPTLFKARILYYSNTSGQCLEMWEDNTWRYTYSLVIMTLHYFGPVVLLIFSYSKIGYNIWVKNIQGDVRNKRRLQLAEAKQRMIKMMITVVVFYALCWLPLHVITIVGDNHPSIYNQLHGPILWLCFHWLAMSNSCYNPIIYIWMSPKFRTGLHLALQSCTRRRRSPCDSQENIYQQVHVVFPQTEPPQRQMAHQKAREKWKRERQLQQKFDILLSRNYLLPGKINSDT